MIGFVGLSHLGIVSALAAASKGFDVIAYDPDAALCEALRQGRLPVSEPQLPELLTATRSRIQFTDDPAALGTCSVVVFARDVPTGHDNRSNLATVQQGIEVIAPHTAPRTVLVVLSQVPPGFTRRLDVTLERIHPQRQLQVFSQVETLVFGCAVERALRPERFIVGCRNPYEPLPQPYAELLNAVACPVFRMRYESAELAKISVNLLLASSVSTTNTLAELCEVLGADWSEIIPALTSDKRIGPHAYVKPGLGLSGGNVERDLATVNDLARLHGTDAGMVEACVSNSRHRRDWILRVLAAQVLSVYQHPVIALWGLAYKPDTDSLKNAPSLALLEVLKSFPVRAYDPQARLVAGSFPNVTQVESALSACQGAEALVVLTPWPEFSFVSMNQVRELMRGQVIIDPFGTLNEQRCREVGFAYVRIGASVQIREEFHVVSS